MSNKSPRKISCIVNPRAAQKKWTRRKNIRNLLHKALSCDIVDTSGDKNQTIELAKKLSLDHDIVVVVGGDGTVADVIQGIMDSGKDVALGILPLGSGNAFRKSLHIPKKVRKALKIIAEGEEKEIDLITIEGKAAGFASVGATAEVTQKALENKIPGLFGHVLEGRILSTLPKRELEAELFEGVDNEGERFVHKKIRLKSFDCVIGKTNYFGYSWRIAPEARIDDSFLDITFFEITGWKYLFFFPLIYFGIYQRFQRHYKAKKMILRGRKLPIQYNGEYLGERDEVRVEVLPKALKVISPSDKQPKEN